MAGRVMVSLNMLTVEEWREWKWAVHAITQTWTLQHKHSHAYTYTQPHTRAVSYAHMHAHLHSAMRSWLLRLVLYSSAYLEKSTASLEVRKKKTKLSIWVADAISPNSGNALQRDMKPIQREITREPITKLQIFFCLSCFTLPKVFPKLLCPKHFPVCHNFQGSEASMAQQNPGWIDLQSLLEALVLVFVLRTSSANIVSVSAAEEKTFSCCRSLAGFFFSVSTKPKLWFIFNE